MSTGTAIVVAVALLIGNAFFVGAEFALVSARRTQIEPRVAEGSRAARITLRAIERVSLMMAGAQLGITVCSLGLGAVGEPAVANALEGPFEALGVPEGLLEPIAFVLAMTIVVFLHMVLGEMVPKNIALAGPERSALLLGPPLYAVVTVLRPLIWLLNQVANGVLRVLRVQPQEEVSSTFTREQVGGLIGESHREGLLDEREHQLLTGALRFDEQRVSDVAIPAERLVTAPVGATVADLERLCAQTGFSRFPVASAAGELTGYVHLKDLLGIPDDERDEHLDPRQVRSLGEVSTGDGLREVLAAMQHAGAHLAVVRDADTSRVIGVVALEDVLEELVGEVRDAAQSVATGSGEPVRPGG